MAQETPESAIELSQFIEHVRSELAKSQKLGAEAMKKDAKGNQSGLRFDVEDLELEMTVMAQGNSKKKGGVKIWVINGGIEGSESNAVTQKVRLKLKPTDVVVSNNGVAREGPSRIAGRNK